MQLTGGCLFINVLLTAAMHGLLEVGSLKIPFLESYRNKIKIIPEGLVKVSSPHSSIHYGKVEFYIRSN